MTKNELLLASANIAIDDLFSDTSIDKEVCLENLEELAASIQDKIDTITAEIGDEE